MIRVGNILINPDSIDTISTASEKSRLDGRDLGLITIIYKSGVVKNFTSDQIGLKYDEFIEKFQEISKKTEDKKLLRFMAAINNKSNG